VRLYVEDAGENRLRLKLNGDDVAVVVVGDGLHDGYAGANSQSTETESIRVWFDGTTAYGWCQTAADVRDSNIQVHPSQECAGLRPGIFKA
jgi:hypothetical protein